MQNRRKALGLELSGIIGTDREAARVMQQARQAAAEIEAFTQTQKEEILAEAQKRREAAEQQVRAEQQNRLSRQKADAKHEFEAARSRLSHEMERNREAWMQTILQRILAGG